MPPASANARSFTRVGADRVAAARSALSRTAIVVRPMPDRRSRRDDDDHDHEHGQHDVVVGALRRQVEAEEVPRGNGTESLRPSERTGWR